MNMLYKAAAANTTESSDTIMLRTRSMIEEWNGAERWSIPSAEGFTFITTPQSHTHFSALFRLSILCTRIFGFLLYLSGKSRSDSTSSN